MPADFSLIAEAWAASLDVPCVSFETKARVEIGVEPGPVAKAVFANGAGLEGQGDVGMQLLMKDESFTAFMEGDETDMDSALADRMKAAGVDMTRFGKQGYGSLRSGSEIYKGVKKNDLMAFLEQSANPISAMGEVNAMDPQGTISTDVAPLGSPEETQKDSEAFNAMIKKRKKTGAPPTVGDLSLNNPTSSSVKRI